MASTAPCRRADLQQCWRDAADGARRAALAVDRWAVDCAGSTGSSDPRRARAVARFQQLSAPVAAKAVEDTAFYRYGRLLSRNDVGFDRRDASRVDGGDFHARMRAARTRRCRARMLATATHDHKRGEDVRARLAVLSEHRDGMGRHCQERWVAVARAAARRRRAVRGDIAMLLQTLVGAWPLDLDARRPAGARRLRRARWPAGRRRRCARPSCTATGRRSDDDLRESRRRPAPSRWSPRTGRRRCCDEIVAFVGASQPAGALNGLAQTLLRLTAPGIPDLYQGTEFWDFSLVDPDNRRPVDWRRRLEAPLDAPFMDLLADWRDGRVKQALVARVLDLRRRLPALFADGDYRPVRVEGAAAAEMLAFARRSGDAWMLVVAPRLPDRLPLVDDGLALIPGGWRDTAIVLEDVPQQAVSCAFTSRTVALDRPRLPLADLCGALPFALLTTG